MTDSGKKLMLDMDELLKKNLSILRLFDCVQDSLLFYSDEYEKDVFKTVKKLLFSVSDELRSQYEMILKAEGLL